MEIKRRAKRKTFSVEELLTANELRLAMRLKTVQEIEDQIIKPNIARINAYLGQQNDTRYMAYAVEYYKMRKAGRG